MMRLPYPGEPGYGGAPGMNPMMGAAGPMTPMQQGVGYDQFLSQAMRMRKRKQMPMYRMPAPPPRFPTPGRMDGARDYPGRQRGMMMPLEGI